MNDKTHSESESTKELQTEERKALRELVLEGLEEKGRGSKWLWLMFALCLTPNIINGFHVSSYVFLSKVPDSYYCIIPQLKYKDWTTEQIRNISVKGGLSVKQSCNVYAHDYDALSELPYIQALAHVQNLTKQPPEVPCFDLAEAEFFYEQDEGASIVPEWNLVCERTALRSNVQVALSVGKFLGASIFGIVSDKYGRKTSFSIAAIIYMFSGVLTTYAPYYMLLLLGRVGLGFCGAGVFYSLFTLVTENSGENHRTWLSISYNFAYPVGMIFLSSAAYFIPEWRLLQLTLTIPSFLLIIHLIFLVESPRWLLSKGLNKRAYQMVFGKKPPLDYALDFKKNDDIIIKSADDDEKKLSFGDRTKEAFQELIKLYGPAKLRQRAIIAHFCWCVTSLSYYVLALNGENLKADRNVYVAITGSVDILGYISSMALLRYAGRKYSSFCLFLLAGVCLLVLLAIPKASIFLVVFTMAGRFGITSVYAIMTLHTAELFPTEIRNSALGISSTFAHVGSIFAPYIVDILGKTAWYIPTTICGVTVLFAGFLTLLQPETKGKALTDHVKQEDFVEETMELKSNKN